MIKELNHVGLLTPDMEESKRFYGDVLGGTVIRDHKDAQGSLFVYIQMALGVIELIRVPPDAANTGLAHVAFLIDDGKDLDGYYEELSGKGFQFTLAPKSTAAGDGRLAFFNDHSGVSFELIQREENIRIRDLTNPHIESFLHIAVCASPEAAKRCDAFYTNEMGFAKNGNRYAIGADALELFVTSNPEVLARPLRNISFGVRNCDETAAYLNSHGEQCSEIEPREDGSRWFNVTRKSGERIVFIGK